MIKKILFAFLVFELAFSPMRLFSTSKVFQVDTGGTLTTGLLTYYKQEDLTEFFIGGGTNDQIGTGSPTFTAGKVNNALTLSGTQFTSTTVASWPHSNQETLAMWVKMAATSDANYWAGGRISGNDAWYLSWNNDVPGSMQWGKDIGGTHHPLTFATTSDTNWHLWIFEQASSGMAMYIDNNKVASNTDNATDTATGVFFQIGAFVSVQPLHGQIDEVGWWSKSLSSQERTDLWNGGSGQTMILSSGTTAPKSQLIWIF